MAKSNPIGTWIAGKITPFIVFLPLAYLGAKTLFGHLIGSGVATKLLQQCPPIPDASAPYRLAYTGQLNADSRLCVLTAFFAHGLKSKAKPFIGHLLSQFPAFVLFPITESLRDGKPRALAFPLALGLAYQNFGGAIILPIFWLIYILVGGHKVKGPSSHIPQHLAEAAMVGLLLGYYIPSTIMYITANPYVTAAWQVFPLWIWLSQFIYLIIRPTWGSTSPSGYNVVQATHILNFAVAVVSHLVLVFPIAFDLKRLGEMFIPSWYVPAVGQSTIATGVHQFLQWDGIIIAGSSLIMSQWFGETVSEQLRVFVWNVLASLLLGPGAAFSGTLMWRERKLKTSSEVKSKEE